MSLLDEQLMDLFLGSEERPSLCQGRSATYAELETEQVPHVERSRVRKRIFLFLRLLLVLVVGFIAVAL